MHSLRFDDFLYKTCLKKCELKEETSSPNNFHLLSTYATTLGRQTMNRPTPFS